METKLRKKQSLPSGMLSLTGGIFVIFSFFALLWGLEKYEFPKNLYALYSLAIIGCIFFYLEYKFVEKDSLHIHMILMVVIVLLGLPTYGSYTDYKLNHFFDNNEIISCDKDISQCKYGVLAVNPKLNYFFCEDAGERKGSQENNPLTCEWKNIK